MGGEINILSIDKVINYPIAKVIAPFLYKIGIVPNHITIFNIFLRCYIGYKTIIYKNHNMIAYYLTTHFLDCLDGTIARMFNLHTKFGAMLDHISDKIFWSFLVINTIVTCRNNKFSRRKIITLSILILIGIFNCNIRNKCDAEDIIDMNAMILISVINSIYNKCIN